MTTNSEAGHCAVCGAQALVSHEKTLIEKKRKFRLATGFLIRTKVPIGIDRWLECKKCGAKQ